MSKAVAQRVLCFWEAKVFALAAFCFSVSSLFRGLAFGFGLALARIFGLDLGFVVDFAFFAAGFFVVDVVFLLVVVVRPVCALGFPGVLTVAVTVFVAYDRHCERTDRELAECLWDVADLSSLLYIGLTRRRPVAKRAVQKLEVREITWCDTALVGGMIIPIARGQCGRKRE